MTLSGTGSPTETLTVTPKHCDTDAECNNHGRCDTATHTCECYQDATNGFWSGSDCNECSPDYFTRTCTHHCGPTTCSGHGHCERFSGKCICDKSDPTGWWAGPSCNQCDERYGDTTTGCTTCGYGYLGAACDVRCVENVTCGYGSCTGAPALPATVVSVIFEEPYVPVPIKLSACSCPHPLGGDSCHVCASGYGTVSPSAPCAVPLPLPRAAGCGASPAAAAQSPAEVRFSDNNDIEIVVVFSAPIAVVPDIYVVANAADAPPGHVGGVGTFGGAQVGGVSCTDVFDGATVAALGAAPFCSITGAVVSARVGVGATVVGGRVGVANQRLYTRGRAADEAARRVCGPQVQVLPTQTVAASAALVASAAPFAVFATRTRLDVTNPCQDYVLLEVTPSAPLRNIAWSCTARPLLHAWLRAAATSSPYLHVPSRFFPAGTTTIEATATDTLGRIATASFAVYRGLFGTPYMSPPHPPTVTPIGNAHRVVTVGASATLQVAVEAAVRKRTWHCWFEPDLDSPTFSYRWSVERPGTGERVVLPSIVATDAAMFVLPPAMVLEGFVVPSESYRATVRVTDNRRRDWNTTASFTVVWQMPPIGVSIYPTNRAVTIGPRSSMTFVGSVHDPVASFRGATEQAVFRWVCSTVPSGAPCVGHPTLEGVVSGPVFPLDGTTALGALPVGDYRLTLFVAEDSRTASDAVEVYVRDGAFSGAVSAVGGPTILRDVFAPAFTIVATLSPDAEALLATHAATASLSFAPPIRAAASTSGAAGAAVVHTMVGVAASLQRSQFASDVPTTVTLIVALRNGTEVVRTSTAVAGPLSFLPVGAAAGTAGTAGLRLTAVPAVLSDSLTAVTRLAVETNYGPDLVYLYARVDDGAPRDGHTAIVPLSGWTSTRSLIVPLAATARSDYAATPTFVVAAHSPHSGSIVATAVAAVIVRGGPAAAAVVASPALPAALLAGGGAASAVGQAPAGSPEHTAARMADAAAAVALLKAGALGDAAGNPPSDPATVAAFYAAATAAIPTIINVYALAIGSPAARLLTLGTPARVAAAAETLCDALRVVNGSVTGAQAVQLVAPLAAMVDQLRTLGATMASLDAVTCVMGALIHSSVYEPAPTGARRGRAGDTSAEASVQDLTLHAELSDVDLIDYDDDDDNVTSAALGAGVPHATLAEAARWRGAAAASTTSADVRRSVVDAILSNLAATVGLMAQIVAADALVAVSAPQAAGSAGGAVTFTPTAPGGAQPTATTVPNATPSVPSGTYYGVQVSSPAPAGPGGVSPLTFRCEVRPADAAGTMTVRVLHTSPRRLQVPRFAPPSAAHPASHPLTVCAVVAATAPLRDYAAAHAAARGNLSRLLAPGVLASTDTALVFGFHADGRAATVPVGGVYTVPVSAALRVNDGEVMECAAWDARRHLWAPSATVECYPERLSSPSLHPSVAPAALGGSPVPVYVNPADPQSDIGSIPALLQSGLTPLPVHPTPSPTVAGSGVAAVRGSVVCNCVVRDAAAPVHPFEVAVFRRIVVPLPPSDLLPVPPAPPAPVPERIYAAFEPYPSEYRVQNWFVAIAVGVAWAVYVLLLLLSFLRERYASDANLAVIAAVAEAHCGVAPSRLVRSTETGAALIPYDDALALVNDRQKQLGRAIAQELDARGVSLTPHARAVTSEGRSLVAVNPMTWQPFALVGAVVPPLSEWRVVPRIRTAFVGFVCAFHGWLGFAWAPFVDTYSPYRQLLVMAFEWHLIFLLAALTYDVNLTDIPLNESNSASVVIWQAILVGAIVAVIAGVVRLIVSIPFRVLPRLPLMRLTEWVGVTRGTEAAHAACDVIAPDPRFDPDADIPQAMAAIEAAAAVDRVREYERLMDDYNDAVRAAGAFKDSAPLPAPPLHTHREALAAFRTLVPLIQPPPALSRHAPPPERYSHVAAYGVPPRDILNGQGLFDEALAALRTGHLLAATQLVLESAHTLNDPIDATCDVRTVEQARTLLYLQAGGVTHDEFYTQWRLEEGSAEWHEAVGLVRAQHVRDAERTFVRILSEQNATLDAAIGGDATHGSCWVEHYFLAARTADPAAARQALDALWADSAIEAAAEANGPVSAYVPLDPDDDEDAVGKEVWSLVYEDMRQPTWHEAILATVAGEYLKAAHLFRYAVKAVGADAEGAPAGDDAVSPPRDDDPVAYTSSTAPVQRPLSFGVKWALYYARFALSVDEAAFEREYDHQRRAARAALRQDGETNELRPGTAAAAAAVTRAAADSGIANAPFQRVVFVTAELPDFVAAAQSPDMYSVGDGSLENPWRSSQGLMLNVRSGDIVLMGPGAYPPILLEGLQDVWLQPIPVYGDDGDVVESPQHLVFVGGLGYETEAGITITNCDNVTVSQVVVGNARVGVAVTGTCKDVAVVQSVLASVEIPLDPPRPVEARDPTLVLVDPLPPRRDPQRPVVPEKPTAPPLPPAALPLPSIMPSTRVVLAPPLIVHEAPDAEPVGQSVLSVLGTGAVFLVLLLVILGIDAILIWRGLRFVGHQLTGFIIAGFVGWGFAWVYTLVIGIILWLVWPRPSSIAAEP